MIEIIRTKGQKRREALTQSHGSHADRQVSEPESTDGHTVSAYM